MHPHDSDKELSAIDLSGVIPQLTCTCALPMSAVTGLARELVLGVQSGTSHLKVEAKLLLGALSRARA